MSSNEQNVSVKAGYDAWAGLYDTYVNSTVAIDDRYFPVEWADLCDARVLEIGCGTGRHTRRLLAQGNRVTAIDLSPGMLKIAHDSLGRSHLLNLIEGDFLDVELPNVGEFDAVVSSLVIEHIRNLDAFFKKVAAVLRPGGRVHISEIHPDRAAAGTLANFTTEDGQVHRLDSVAHTALSIESASAGAGLRALGSNDILGDQTLVAKNPAWAKHLGKPLIKTWAWRK